MPARDSRPILVVEDHSSLARNLCRHIERNSPYSAESVENGLEAVDRILSDDPLLVILDIGLPGIDGFEVCRRVRPKYSGPILFLSGEKKDKAQLEGFRLGGNDYVTKPASFDLVMARIENLLHLCASGTRLSQIHDSRDSRNGLPEGILSISGNLFVNLPAQRVEVDGIPLELTMGEWNVLECLITANGEPVSRDELHAQLNYQQWDGVSRSVDLVVSRLRSKLHDSAERQRVIRTVRNRGYALIMHRTAQVDGQ